MENMDDILKEASAAVECKECPWYRNCVMPLQLAPDDMRRLKMMMEKSGFNEGESELEKAIESMARALYINWEATLKLLLAFIAPSTPSRAWAALIIS